MASEEPKWLPADSNRQLKWPTDTGNWGEHRLWLLEALMHWTWHHGYDGQRMQNQQLAGWCKTSASTISAWIKNGGVASSGLDFCLVAQEQSGCPSDCERGFGDRSLLKERYERADQDFQAGKDGAHSRSSGPSLLLPAYDRPLKDVASKLSALKRAQEAVRQALQTVTVNPYGLPLDQVTLQQVRVERAAEKDVLRHIDRQLAGTAPGQAAALIGEPGVGKSCSLWGVYEALFRRTELCLVLLSATSLLAGPGAEPDLHPHELPKLLEAHRGQPAAAVARGRTAAPVQRPIVLLLDTADLLLHETQSAQDFTELITVLRARNIAVALACRSGEANLLKRSRDGEKGEGAYTSLLSNIPLLLYGTGKKQRTERGWTPDSELGQAIAAYGRMYAPARQENDGLLPRMRMEQSLADAAARGLPLSQLIRHPLHLRMVFDLYSPHGPNVAELDVAALFRDYWDRRVERDLRDSVTGLDTVAGEEARQLGRAAAELGLVTLFRGTIEFHREHARDLLASRCGVPAGTAAAWIGLLIRRGVLSEGVDGRVRFHHQVIGEYAAGRGLAHARAGLSATTRRITEHPQDLYLAEAARHAFHYTDRARAHESRRWYPHLAVLSRAAAPVARDTFLRIVAGLRHAPSSAAVDIVAVIEEPDTGALHAEHYLDALCAIVRPDADIWPTVLETIWNVVGVPLRDDVMRAVATLVLQQRDAATRFVYSLPPGDLVRHTPAAHLTDLMHCAHAYDVDSAADVSQGGTGRPERTALATMQEMLDEAFVERGAPLEHALTSLADLAARWPTQYSGLCNELPRRMAVADKISKDADGIIASAAACWAAARANDRTTDTLKALQGCLDELATGSPPTGSLHVVLHGVATALCRPDAHPAPRLLRSALDDATALAVDDSAGRTVARYFLRPLLLAGDAPAGLTARKWCQDLADPRKAGQDPRRPGTVLALTALGTLGGRRLPGAVVAACLPDDPRSARPRTATLLPWISPPWDADLTVAAAAGGHHLATRALALLAEGTEHKAPESPVPEQSEAAQPEHAQSKDASNPGKGRRRGKQPRKHLIPPRDEVVARVPEAPGLLLPWLLRDAEQRKDADALIGFVRAKEQLPVGHHDELTSIAAHLTAQGGHQAIAAAHRLTARMISCGTAPLGSPEDVVQQIKALNTSATAQTELLTAVTRAVTVGLASWDLSAARQVLAPHLDAVVDRAVTTAATVADPGIGHEAYMLAGYAAQLLRARLAVLDARRRVAEGANDLGLEQVEALVFLPAELCLLPGHSLTRPGSVWPRRFDTVPRLCVDLHEAGHRQHAERLLERAVTVATEQSGPSARWRHAGWNPWRSYLRLLVGERSRLYDLLIEYGPRDHQLTRHLLEVAGQTVTDISAELHRLLTDPTWPAELRDAARRTASWAGRDGANLRWETLYEDTTAS
ncbi:hypothetical protein [Kitasatospora sp. NPDC088134]|uniref:hypothetical protein n=1 Tax=Kitasatospora sp. NPDC088134 TaxID=3364071 RepID=UPI0037F6B50D